MTYTKADLKNWVKAYTEDLFKWALYKTSSEQLAEDLVQDTFLAAAEKLYGFKAESSPKTWLFSILNNKIVDYYRRKFKTPQTIGDDIIGETFDDSGNWHKNRQPKDWQLEEHNILDDDDFKAVLKQCMDDLPAQWSSCMKLKYLMGKNGTEICQELEISPTNFWQIVHRAKLHLRKCLENNWYKDY